MAPEVTDKLIAAGCEIVIGSPEEFGQLLREEIDRWGRVIRESKVTIEQ